MRGETRIILGPAGGGKSVLHEACQWPPSIRTQAPFASSAKTSAICASVDLFKLRARIGMVFQESALFDSLSVEDNVAYRLHEDRVPEEEVPQASRRSSSVR